ncbi:MAG: YkgJ family cysteine cluster protein [Candidatus Buchananbacteria bacterium]|nr:YkgJ family cysteine cluster protein [Candidatus Buchananbacteria bacterium]
MSEKNKELCHKCDLCCKYVAIGIDKPKSKTDYQNIIWQLWHENVNIFVDHDNDWYVEFETPCLALDKKTSLCAVYENRPKICRDYKQVDCVRYNNDPAEKIYFKTPASFEKYLKKKNIDYKFVYNQ